MAERTVTRLEPDPEFAKALNRASEIVSRWPEWKRNVLQSSSQQTRSTPRESMSDEPPSGFKKACEHVASLPGTQRDLLVQSARPTVPGIGELPLGEPEVQVTYQRTSDAVAFDWRDDRIADLEAELQAVKAELIRRRAAQGHMEQELAIARGREMTADDIADYVDDRKQMQKRIADLQRWKDAFIEAAVVDETYTKADEDDPKGCLNRLLSYAQRIALDPSVSQEAKALHGRIAKLEACLRQCAFHATTLEQLFDAAAPMALELADIPGYVSDCMAALELRIAKLEAAIKSEISRLETLGSLRTHYPGCEASHPVCAAIGRLRAALDPEPKENR